MAIYVAIRGTVFQHCPLRDIQGCGFCVVRQRPICCSAALHAVAADTRGDNLRRILEWRRVSQPAHLVEFTRGRTCPLRTEGLIVSWSSTTGVGVSARTHQQLKEDGGRADSHLLGMASASAVHGTLNPPPIPTVIPAPTYTAAAGASGDGVAGLLSLPDDALNAVVSLIITPAAGSSSGSDTLSVACLGASCRRLNRLCQQHLPALLSYRWEPLPSPPPAPPLTPSSQADAVAAGGASPSRLTRLAAQFPELELWQQQETTAVMTMEHNPSPELLHRLRRLASTSSIDDDDDDGPTMAPPPPLDTPLTDASADDLVALFPNGVPARFRPVRRWQPNHELISVGRVGAPPSALQWQMTGDTMGGHLQDCIRRHEAAEEADASMGFLNVEKAHDASESERGSTGVSGLSLLRSMVHAHQDELEAWRRRIAEKTLINHFNCSQ